MAWLIEPPVSPMLAKLQDELPAGEVWLYEPKWDGFRAIVFRDGAEVHIASRDHKPLNRYFPELPGILSSKLPQRCVVDGEIVVGRSHGLDFDALLQRIHPAASRIEMLAQQDPASFIVFDLLADEDADLRELPLHERHDRMVQRVGAPVSAAEALDRARGRGGRVFVTPCTTDLEIARSWFYDFEEVGLDGIIAKQLTGPYRPGRRGWIKVKHKRTADCVVGGYRLSKAGDGVGSLLLGLYSGDHLHYVGHTSSFKASERKDLLAKLAPLEGGSSFGHGRSPGGPSRWSQGREATWIPLDPLLVCEVGFDYWQSDRFRHAATFHRWRPDKDPKECTFDQLFEQRGLGGASAPP